jgi:hypothetical protein
VPRRSEGCAFGESEETVSTETVGRWPTHARRQEQAAPPAQTGGERADEVLEFVRFCYRRRRVAWPDLYDEMAAVAARGAFRGLGYFELAEHGIHFSLDHLPGLAALAQRVAHEEQVRHEPFVRQEPGRSDAPVPMMLVAQPARG